jgi:ankyrin repeat protein
MKKIIKFLIIVLLLMFLFSMTACGNGIGKAVEKGDVETVRAWIEKNPKAVDAYDDKGFTLLHLAAREGRKEILGLLLQKGASVNARSRDGEGVMPLHLAADRGHKGCVELLLDNGADINVMDRQMIVGYRSRRFTTLCFAVANGHDELVELLIKRGAEVNPTPRVTLTPLDIAVRIGNLKIARLLIEKGADVNGKVSATLTPLFSAVYSGNLEMVKLLVENGANVNHRAYRRLTPLHWTTYWEKPYPEITRLLLEHGSEVDPRTEDKNTPLHYAASNGYARCAALLLKNGASIEARNFWGATPLDLAKKEVAKLLLSLHRAAAAEEPNRVESILEKYPQLLNARDRNGKTPLHYAVESNSIKAAGILIDRGADANAVSWFKRIELIHGMVGKLVIPQLGRVKRLRDEKKPLQIAVEKGYAEMTRLLETHGADKK